MRLICAACIPALAACGGGGNNSEGTSPSRYAGTGEIATIPTAQQVFTGDVTAMFYDPATEILTITGDPFDLAGDFVRVPEKDVRGFAAFENEGGARKYTALVRTDTVNGLSAGAVGTPIRLNNQFGGTMLARDEIPGQGSTPQLPMNVELTHVGDYAGVRNVGANVGADDSNSFLYRVEGKVRLDLDFFDDQPTGGGIEGVIFDRRSMDETVEVDGDTRSLSLDDVVLEFTAIDAEGNFTGVADGGSIGGTYSGVTGGDGATASAGVIEIGSTDDIERGAFIAQTE